MKSEKISLIIVPIILVFGCLLMWAIYVVSFRNNADVSGKIRIKDFTQAEISCAALMPACGYCPGQIIEKECYVTPAEFDEYKKSYSNLREDD